MRTLHTNPRNYQEPFQLILIDHERFENGMDSFKILNRMIVFGSIMNRAINYSQSNIDDQDATISIKIVSQGLNIKPKDRIRYNKNQYIITSISRDYYSKNETVILCHFEKDLSKNEGTILNFLLNSVMVS